MTPLSYSQKRLLSAVEAWVGLFPVQSWQERIKMTRTQQEKTRALLHAKKEWLMAYHWTEVSPGRWTHKSAPSFAREVTIKDALAFTEADPLKYGAI